MIISQHNVIQEIKYSQSVIKSGHLKLQPFQFDLFIDAIADAMNARWYLSAHGLNLFWEAVYFPQNFCSKLRFRQRPLYKLSSKDVDECIRFAQGLPE